MDDDAQMREGLGLVVSVNGHDCGVAPDATAAIESVDRRSFDVVTCGRHQGGYERA
jgi:DNA-binding response OmpR family regulator